MRRGSQVWPSLGWSSGAGVFHEHSRDWVPTLVSSMLLGWTAAHGRDHPALSPRGL